jgi:3-methyladenine DNA glycosylase AlkD
LWLLRPTLAELLPTRRLKAALAQLDALGHERVRAPNTRIGARAKQYSAQLGDIRKLANKIKADHDLGLALGQIEDLDGRLLAVLSVDPRKRSSSGLNRMVRSASFAQLADWLNAYVVKQHPDRESMREKWMKSKDHKAARALCR